VPGADALSPSWLKVCVTCDRYGRPPGSLGAALAAALEEAGSSLIAAGQIVLRKVPCLSGCKNPGNVELGRLGGEKIRLSNVEPGQVPAIIESIGKYVGCGSEPR
jgi:predicted metal-binding protein